MAKKTMKQLEEEVEAHLATIASQQQAYDILSEQTQKLQAGHTQRLAFLRILEGFANSVDAALAQVKRDVQELNEAMVEQQKREAAEREGEN